MQKLKSATVKLVFLLFFPALTLQAQKKISKRQINDIKIEIMQEVEDRHKNTQVMIDKVFSCAE